MGYSVVSLKAKGDNMHAKHKSVTTKACTKLREPKGKHENFSGGRGKNTAQTAVSEAKYE